MLTLTFSADGSPYAAFSSHAAARLVIWLVKDSRHTHLGPLGVEQLAAVLQAQDLLQLTRPGALAESLHDGAAHLLAALGCLCCVLQGPSISIVLLQGIIIGLGGAAQLFGRPRCLLLSLRSLCKVVHVVVQAPDNKHAALRFCPRHRSMRCPTWGLPEYQ